MHWGKYSNAGPIYRITNNRARDEKRQVNLIYNCCLKLNLIKIISINDI